MTRRCRPEAARGEAPGSGPHGITMTATEPASITPAGGKLGVLCVGRGDETLIAGVELAPGDGRADRLLTQLGTIRLGTRTRTASRSSGDFVSLAHRRSVLARDASRTMPTCPRPEPACSTPVVISRQSALRRGAPDARRA
jgi:hypothetical protein